jgi:hypothetical protein
MHFFAENTFYHEETKRLLIAVSNLFSGITIRKEHADGVAEQAFKVPVDFGQKNKWVSMIRERPDVTKNQVQITLPRMVFEIGGFQRAPKRKMGTEGTFIVADTPLGRTKVFNPSAWDVNVQLHVMTKDQNDALQVVEQLTPFFQPKMSVNFDILPEFTVKKDIPIVLSGVEMEDKYEGVPDDQRVVVYTFNLVAKMFFFGPIQKPSSVIKDVRVNMKIDSSKVNRINRTYVNPLTAKKQDPHSVVSLWS